MTFPFLTRPQLRKAPYLSATEGARLPAHDQDTAGQSKAGEKEHAGVGLSTLVVSLETSWYA